MPPYTGTTCSAVFCFNACSLLCRLSLLHSAFLHLIAGSADVNPLPILVPRLEDVVVNPAVGDLVRQDLGVAHATLQAHTLSPDRRRFEGRDEGCASVWSYKVVVGIVVGLTFSRNSPMGAASCLEVIARDAGGGR